MGSSTRRNRRSETGQSVHYTAGVVASLFAEVVFTVLGVAISALRNEDVWSTVKMPGTLVLGSDRTQTGSLLTSEIGVGILVHVLLAVLVGMIYSALLPHLRISPISGGVATGLILYLLGLWILPAAFPHWLSSWRVPLIDLLIELGTHAIYGVVFGMTYSSLVRFKHSHQQRKDVRRRKVSSTAW